MSIDLADLYLMSSPHSPDVLLTAAQLACDEVLSLPPFAQDRLSDLVLDRATQLQEEMDLLDDAPDAVRAEKAPAVWSSALVLVRALRLSASELLREAGEMV